MIVYFAQQYFQRKVNLMTAQSEHVSREKIKSFCGSAKIWICKLQPEDMYINPRQLDPKNVARLKNVYQLEGCHRFEPEHHIPVITKINVLEQALQRANISMSRIKSLDEPTFLEFDDNLTYLHGRHRLEAAKEFLPPDENWWIADFYLEGDN